MKYLAIVFSLAIMASVPAMADEVVLTDSQLDRVQAAGYTWAVYTVPSPYTASVYYP